METNVSYQKILKRKEKVRYEKNKLQEELDRLSHTEPFTQKVFDELMLLREKIDICDLELCELTISSMKYKSEERMREREEYEEKLRRRIIDPRKNDNIRINIDSKEEE